MIRTNAYNPYRVMHDLPTIVSRIAARYAGNESLQDMAATLEKAKKSHMDMIKTSTDTRNMLCGYVLMDMLGLMAERRGVLVNHRPGSDEAAAVISVDIRRDMYVLCSIACEDDLTCSANIMDPVLLGAIADAQSVYAVQAMVCDDRGDHYCADEIRLRVRKLADIASRYAADTDTMTLDDRMAMYALLADAVADDDIPDGCIDPDVMDAIKRIDQTAGWDTYALAAMYADDAEKDNASEDMSDDII